LEKIEEDKEGTDLSTNALFVALSTEGKFAHWAIEDFLDQVLDEDEGESESELDDEPQLTVEKIDPTGIKDFRNRILTMSLLEEIPDEEPKSELAGKKRKKKKSKSNK